jgi:isoleucyl-tRNA synthetase
MTSPGRPYPDVSPQPSFPEIEERVGARWRENKTFERSVEQREAGPNGENEYVFYDGPPFANGTPHFGHMLTGYVKDVVPRYQTMRGHRVERRFGWDCHGLPAEMAAEKELGVSGRTAILDYGIDNFNDHCRRAVYNYTELWQETVQRSGRWVDFGNDYKTMDKDYMESVLWAFKRLWDKGLLYEGYRVMPFSWACQTPVSNFETRMDDAYRERQDPAVTVRFELEAQAGDELPTDLLAWTTTPWTLPSNLALAVGPDIDYAVLEQDGRRIILCDALVERYAAELGEAERVGTLKGSELAGRAYKPLFPYFAGQENAFRVLAADFVEIEEGTGVVHMAPGFGEDDMAVCKEAGIAVVVPVDEAGAFTAEVTDYAGQHVHEANKAIIRDLKDSGRLLRHETIVHNYPHCWRTDTPLIYRAMNSWYVKVTDIKDDMIRNNQEINWIPGHIKDGLFGKWLENTRDWSISRNRFWGAPIPVWKSDNPVYPRIDVYGSIAELEKDFGVPVTDLHRPAIDELVRPNPDDPTGQSMMRRIPDVLDCWFESGSMFYAQVHYPFENKEWFDDHFPSDFVVEYVSQTRGWFYSMHVLATALFDKHPFKNCICHGVLGAEDGQKLSKRLRNYPEPELMFAKHGSDALRWYLVSSPVLRGGDLKVEREGKPVGEVVRNVLMPVWNAWYFFSLYANADGITANPAGEGATVLDRYALAKTRELVETAQERMDAYDVAGACQAIVSYLDALNNWYIRRSRPRFWSDETSPDKQAAYDTLGRALRTLCQVAAPLLPFLSDEVYAGLSGGADVHLAAWPEAADFPAERELVADMDTVRDVCSAGLSMRRQENVRVRQPLRSLTIAGSGVERLRPFLDLIQDEMNVKSVELSEEIEAFADFRLQVNARAIGPRLGGETKKVIAASKQGDWSRNDDGSVTTGGQTLTPEEFEFRLNAKDGVSCQALSSGEMIVVVDFELDEALIQEGYARDVVRLVQQARRDAGLHVSDRIRLAMGLPDEYRAAVSAFSDYVKENTLASELSLDGAEAESQEHQLGGSAVQVSVSKVAA